jgi:uncharacterized protein (TIGR02145 family)
MKEISTEDRIRRFKLTCTLNDNGVERHFHHGYEYVEIGGLKWAKYNVGAEKETDSGLYFQWGDTQGYTSEQVGDGEGKKRFIWGDYKFGRWQNLIKYNRTDGKSVLDLEDDAARANMSGSWRIPTEEEFQSLIENTTSKWTEINGVRGRKFTSKSDKTKYVFFPVAGYCNNGSLNVNGSNGCVWSSTLDGDNERAKFLNVLSGGKGVSSYYYRYYGFSVRAVRKL